MIETVDLVGGTVLLSSGELCEITKWIDIQGRETKVMEGVMAVVAGPTKAGKWYAIRIDPEDIPRRQ